MPMYVIERDIAAVGKLITQDHAAVSRKSCSPLQELAAGRCGQHVDYATFAAAMSFVDAGSRTPRC